MLQSWGISIYLVKILMARYHLEIRQNIKWTTKVPSNTHLKRHLDYKVGDEIMNFADKELLQHTYNMRLLMYSASTSLMWPSLRPKHCVERAMYNYVTDEWINCTVQPGTDGQIYYNHTNNLISVQTERKHCTVSEPPSCSLVEIARFEHTKPLFGTAFGVISLEFHGHFWHRKTKSPWAIVRRC